MEKENLLDNIIKQVDKLSKCDLEVLKKHIDIMTVNDSRSIKNSDDVYLKYLKKYGNKKQEHFIAVFLDSSNNVIKSKVITIGLLNKSQIHPREIFNPAIKLSCASIIIAHNHPSGNITPSNEDLSVTKRIVEAGEIIGIHVIDHLIVTREKYYSFLEHGNI